MPPDSSRDSVVDIRPATAADAPLVLQLIHELAEYEKLSHAVTADEEAIRRELLGRPGGAEVLLAFGGDDPAGFAVYFFTFSTFLARPGLYLEDLFVRPGHRRRGVGRALLGRLAREANRRGCGRFEWAVLDWNQPAQDFYLSLGARILDDWRICRLEGEALRSLGAGPFPT